MSKILVTGGNGFVAAHVLIATLNQGYEVVATVRTQEKAEQTRMALAPRVGDKIAKLSFYIVPTIEVDGAFDKVIQAHQFLAVLHTATPFHLKAKDPKEITGPAVGSTKSILKSIKNFGPSVKRVIITSSFAAIIDSSKGFRPGYVYSEADWNPVCLSIEQATRHAYYGAKTWAERAAWDFMKEQNPQFELITLCPPTVYGEVAQYVPSTDALNTSSERLNAILTGLTREIPLQTLMFFVNAQDLGKAHALAITAPDAGNRRFFITADAPFTNKAASDAFIKHYPETASIVPTRVPSGFDEEGFPIGGHYMSDNSLSKQLLGLTYQTFEETVIQFAESVKNLPSEIKTTV